MAAIVRRGPLFGRDVNGPPTEIGVFVPPEAVFPGTKGTEAELVQALSRMSRDDALFWCGRVNTIVSGPGDFDIKGRQQRAITTLCTPLEIERINAFARAQPSPGPPTVFFRGQMLELVRWVARCCRNLPGDGETFKVPETRSRFVMAALIAGMIWSRRIYGDKLSRGGEVQEMRRRAIGSFRKAMEESSLAPHYGVTLGRGTRLFGQYFPLEYSEFKSEFQKSTGLSLEQYLTCAAALCTYAISNRPEGPLFVTKTVAGTTTYGGVLSRFLDVVAQAPARLATTLWDDFERTGYRPLRERPVFVAESGCGMILDPTFFLECISSGPLFRVLAGKNKKKANEIFGAFGKAFEKYANDILRRMYPHRQGLVDRLIANAQGKDGMGRAFEIDGALTGVDDTVMFEMKAGWVRESEILDEEGFIRELRDKFGVSPDAGERDKGVAQLARSIGAIARGEWWGPTGEFRSARRFFPVLVTHDARMAAPGATNFLAEEFRRLLNRIPPTIHVEPLTLMTIDDLENMESSVESFSISEMLFDYARACPDRLRSLHNFIALSKYGPKIRPSGDLIRSSLEFAESMKHELFPNSA